VRDENNIILLNNISLSLAIKLVCLFVKPRQHDIFLLCCWK